MRAQPCRSGSTKVPSPTPWLSPSYNWRATGEGRRSARVRRASRRGHHRQAVREPSWRMSTAHVRQGRRSCSAARAWMYSRRTHRRQLRHRTLRHRPAARRARPGPIVVMLVGVIFFPCRLPRFEDRVSIATFALSRAAFAAVAASSVDCRIKRNCQTNSSICMNAMTASDPVKIAVSTVYFSIASSVADSLFLTRRPLPWPHDSCRCRACR